MAAILVTCELMTGVPAAIPGKVGLSVKVLSPDRVAVNDPGLVGRTVELTRMRIDGRVHDCLDDPRGFTEETMTQTIQDHPIAAAFITAVEQGMPRASEEVRQAARKAYDRKGQGFLFDFQLPNGWRVTARIGAVTAYFSIPEVCPRPACVSDAVHKIRTAIVRCAFVRLEITPDMWREFHRFREAGFGEGWTDEEHAQAALACAPGDMPGYVQKAAARLMAENVEETRVYARGEVPCTY